VILFVPQSGKFWVATGRFPAIFHSSRFFLNMPGSGSEVVRVVGKFPRISISSGSIASIGQFQLANFLH
jgi:hypothetical protein